MKRYDLEGKVAIVTGGARGIGRAICERYAAERARVAVADILVEEARAAAAALGEPAFAVELDVTKQESIDRLVETVVARAGGIDILVNNAAVFDLAPVLAVTKESFDRVFAVNAAGLFFTLQAVARHILDDICQEGEGRQNRRVFSGRRLAAAG